MIVQDLVNSDIRLIATNASWIVGTNKGPAREDFQELTPGTSFKSIGGGKNTSAAFPKLEAADGWHYQYEGMIHEYFQTSPAASEEQHELFLFSAFNKYGESGLENWSDYLGKQHAYFCFNWVAAHDWFFYSTASSSSRCIAPIFKLCKPPQIIAKPGQMSLPFNTADSQRLELGAAA